jgi:predicted HD superfamily hydrolase involved in NAD metabolism
LKENCTKNHNLFKDDKVLYNRVIMEKRLSGLLSARRMAHSAAVSDQAVILAKRYGADVQKAAIAGLLHDCARDIGYQESLIKAKEFGIILDNVTKKSPKIIHAVIGPCIARQLFGIDDIEILDAIRYHTTGRENMSLLEKVVFLADYIEPGRDFSGVDKIRTTAVQNLDRAILEAIDGIIIHLIERKELIHEDTLRARNYLLIEQ